MPDVRPRPTQWSNESAATFSDSGVATAYQYRAPYPPSLFDQLLTLLPVDCRRVLDGGAGTGFVARPLASHVEWIDAVDPSAAMIAEGQRLPNGDHPNLHWIRGRAEDAPLNPPYGLVTAGASLHWMDWETVLPRWRRMLVSGGTLAILDTNAEPTPWKTELDALIAQYSVIRDWQRLDLVAELVERGLFRQTGRWSSDVYWMAQPREEYLEALHSMSSLSRARMGEAHVASFDEALNALLPPAVRLPIVATMVWGEPQEPTAIGCAEG